MQQRAIYQFSKSSYMQSRTARFPGQNSKSTWKILNSQLTSSHTFSARHYFLGDLRAQVLTRDNGMLGVFCMDSCKKRSSTERRHRINTRSGKLLTVGGYFFLWNPEVKYPSQAHVIYQLLKPDLSNLRQDQLCAASFSTEFVYVE